MCDFYQLYVVCSELVTFLLIVVVGSWIDELCWFVLLSCFVFWMFFASIDFICYVVVIFFNKQKTAYDMRISDWSSDVCSSDLKRDQLDALIDTINGNGYGLTFGVHTRLDETVAHVTQRIKAGNVYVNRNIVGAVVGVQPFGGEGLSGTGPKAGGPLYLLRLLSRRPPGLPDWYLDAKGEDAQGREVVLTLPGPTGESNTYHLKPRGTVLCVAASEAGARTQFQACTDTGNVSAMADTEAARAFLATCTPAEESRVKVVDRGEIGQADYQAVLFEGDGDALRRSEEHTSELQSLMRI